MTVLGIVHAAAPLTQASVRASRMVDLLRVLGVADYDVWRHPALVAATIALTHQVGRVVLARDPEALGEVDARVTLDPLNASWPEGAPTFLANAGDATTSVAPAPASVAPAPASVAPAPASVAPAPASVAPAPASVAPAPARETTAPATSAPHPELHLVSGRAEVLIPQHPRRVPVSPAILAATLYLADRPTLLPTVDYHAPDPLESRADRGECLLALHGPSRRVGRGPGFPRRAPAPTPPSDAPPTSELAPLERALTALCERSAHRLPPGPAGRHTLEREARKLLQAEVAAGRIKAFALAAIPQGPDLQDLALEVVVTLPRRVGQVILRLGPRS